MDRTSILGDTIDYMKELLDRIKTLRGEIAEMGGSTNNSMDIFKDIKSKEILIRNTPKVCSHYIFVRVLLVPEIIAETRTLNRIILHENFLV